MSQENHFGNFECRARPWTGSNSPKTKGHSVSFSKMKDSICKGVGRPRKGLCISTYWNIVWCLFSALTLPFSTKCRVTGVPADMPRGLCWHGSHCLGCLLWNPPSSTSYLFWKAISFILFSIEIMLPILIKNSYEFFKYSSHLRYNNPYEI